MHGLVETSFHLNGFDEGDFNSLHRRLRTCSSLIATSPKIRLMTRISCSFPTAQRRFAGDNVIELKGLLPGTGKPYTFEVLTM